jgi:hypothetical protein
MERITDDESYDDIYSGNEEEIDYEDLERLHDNFTKEELVRMCSGFARENMKLVHWLYKYHKDILREFENKHLGGKRIEFLN